MAYSDQSSDQTVDRTRRPQTRRCFIIDQRTELAAKIAQRLDGIGDGIVGVCSRLSDANAELDGWLSKCDATNRDVTVVLSPMRTLGESPGVDLDCARAVIDTCRRLRVSRLILISSAEIYQPHYTNPGLMLEKDVQTGVLLNRVARTWSEIEASAEKAVGEERLVILRPCWTLCSNQGVKSRDFAQRLFGARLTFPLAGFDPNLQLLSLDDLSSAVTTAVNHDDVHGVYNVAPDDTIPLSQGLRLAGVRRLPLPYTLQRVVCAVRHRMGLKSRNKSAGHELDYIRYSWTVSNEKMKRELGYQPQVTCSDTILKFRAAITNVDAKTLPAAETHDEFGMEKQYVKSCGRWQFRFAEKAYWRIESEGLQNVPRAGGGVLTGIHRGFMPFDGVMMIHLLSKYVGRYPRFLLHPGLIKFPYLAPFLIKTGGVVACRDNFDHVLRDGGLAAIFPEGIRGAFRMYDREVYQLGKFRDDYVEFAIRHQVPIIPFVTVGPAEAFPIFGKIRWSWWKRLTHWPFFPITATWPLAPIPLPSKWHFKILDPIPTEDYRPSAADDRKIVRELSQQVRAAMQSEIDDMVNRRKSIFFGSIFQTRKADSK